jgi:hypothetical protein
MPLVGYPISAPLCAEIKNDLKGKLDYEDQISRIRKRRAELEARIKKNQQLMVSWTDNHGSQNITNLVHGFIIVLRPPNTIFKQDVVM